MILQKPQITPVDDGRGFIVVPDLHGRLDALELVLAEYPERNYLFLGDLVDRGPHSRAVLNRVRELVEAQRAHLCMGNHEWMMLAAASELATEGRFGTRATMWLLNGGDCVMDDYPRSEIGDFLRDAQWIAEHAQQWVVAEGGFFAHAHRLPPALVDLYEAQGPEALEADANHMTTLVHEMPHLWARPGDPLPTLPKETGYSVHGHTPQRCGEPLVQLDVNGQPAIFVDLGTVFRTGRFAIFDTETRAVRVFSVPR